MSSENISFTFGLVTMATTVTTIVINFVVASKKKMFLTIQECLLQWLFVFFVSLNFYFWVYKLRNYSLKIGHKLTTL